jgi:hypothetical protein
MSDPFETVWAAWFARHPEADKPTASRFWQDGVQFTVRSMTTISGLVLELCDRADALEDDEVARFTVGLCSAWSSAFWAARRSASARSLDEVLRGGE